MLGAPIALWPGMKEWLGVRDDLPQRVDACGCTAIGPRDRYIGDSPGELTSRKPLTSHGAWAVILAQPLPAARNVTIGRTIHGRLGQPNGRLR